VVDVRALQAVGRKEALHDARHARAGQLRKLARQVQVTVVLGEVQADRTQRVTDLVT